MSRGPLVVVGDTLLDRDILGRVERVCPDAPAPVFDEDDVRSRPGGAGLAAALAASDGGRDVVLVTALGHDEPAEELRTLLREAKVEVVDLRLFGRTPEKVRLRSRGQSVLRHDRNAGERAPVGECSEEAADVIASAGAVLVSDYGRGVAAQDGVRAALTGLDRRVPTVWDPHPRGVLPVPGCRLVTPNRSEAEGFATGVEGAGLSAHTLRARTLRDRWQAAAVSITLGAHGALLVEGDGAPLVAPATKPAAGDTCGAGDRFASAAISLLADGALVSEAVVGAVESATAFVAAGGAAAYGDMRPTRLAERQPRAGTDAGAVIESVRRQGGRVIATGGCFDILHAGHVSLLQAARSLGDCLVVCLNSDASVRRLKGDGRPRSSQQDRTDVLLALECVDAVAVFEEDTPAQVLARLRPDVFVKGGDYAGADLPEAKVLAEWGGQAVVVPYLEGRSTTRLLQEAARR